MTDAVKLPPMQWHHDYAWNQWSLVSPVNGAEVRRVYGPFSNAWEIDTAAQVHGVPFCAQPEVS